MALTTIPDRALDAFRAEWHRADDEGDKGNRVLRGLTAALPHLPQTSTLTLTGPTHLVAHIQGLERTLGTRNQTIARLEAELAIAKGDPSAEPSQPALRAAFRGGYEACRVKVQQAQQEAARVASSLSESLRRANVDAYLAAPDAHTIDEEVGA